FGQPDPHQLDQPAEDHHSDQSRIDDERDRMRRERGQDLDHSPARKRSGRGYRPMTVFSTTTIPTATACQPRGSPRLRPSRSEPGNHKTMAMASTSARGQNS